VTAPFLTWKGKKKKQSGVLRCKPGPGAGSPVPRPLPSVWPGRGLFLVFLSGILVFLSPVSNLLQGGFFSVVSHIKLIILPLLLLTDYI